jgi:hypothetical protein
MPFKTETGFTIQPDRPFTLGDIQYPATWLRLTSAEEKAALGISWEEPPKLKDERWYQNTVKDGEVTSTPIPLEQLKERETANAKKNAGAMLSGSDWMVIRSVDEEERPVPIEWASFREAVRAECNRMETAIAASSFDSLRELKADWPNDPNWKELGE